MVVGWIEATGMAMVRVVAFTVLHHENDGTESQGEYWLIEAEWL